MFGEQSSLQLISNHIKDFRVSLTPRRLAFLVYSLNMKQSRYCQLTTGKVNFRFLKFKNYEVLAYYISKHKCVFLSAKTDIVRAQQWMTNNHSLFDINNKRYHDMYGYLSFCFLEVNQWEREQNTISTELQM